MLSRIYLIKYIITAVFVVFAIATKADTSSVARLMEQCEEARSLSQYERLKQYSNQIISGEAGKADARSETFAYFYNGLARLFTGEADASQKVFDKAYALAEKHGNDSVKALVMNARGIYHAIIVNNKFVAQQFFFKSLRLADEVGFEDLKYRVRGNLLTLSHSTGGDIVLENAREVYDYGVKHGNKEQIAMGTYYMATYYCEHAEYQAAEQYLKIALETYKSYPYEDIASIYSLYAKMLLSQNKTEEARSMVKESIALAKKYKQTSMEVDAFITYAELLVQEKDYALSCQMTDSAMQKASEMGMTSKLITCNQLLADNMLKMGNVKGAAERLARANALLTEQATIDMERLAHEQQIMTDIEQKEMEAKLKQEQITAQRRLLLILGVAIVFLLILLAFIVRNYRHRQLLYRKIVLQNTRAVARQHDMQEHIERLMQELQTKNDRQPAPQEPDTDKPESTEPEPEAEAPAMDSNKMNALYAELCRRMEHERLYAEPQLTRERMAEHLGTNRTYLTRVIKEKTGMNYLQFINSYRINEAISILSDKDKVNYPLKQIWSDLGFSSPSTFFKLFQQTVGITPSTYRKQFLEVRDTEPEMEDEDNNLI